MWGKGKRKEEGAALWPVLGDGDGAAAREEGERARGVTQVLRVRGILTRSLAEAVLQRYVIPCARPIVLRIADLLRRETRGGNRVVRYVGRT